MMYAEWKLITCTEYHCWNSNEKYKFPNEEQLGCENKQKK